MPRGTMKVISIILIGLFIVSCAHHTTGTTEPQSPVYHHDLGVISSEIEKLTVGMSPRRVFSEFNNNNWSLTSLSTITLEDMIENNISEGNFYISTKGAATADLEVFFQDSRVIFIRTTYLITDNEYELELTKAKHHLASLGAYDEKVKSDSIQITYQPHQLSYVYYKFYKLIKNQKGYNVWFTVANVKS